MNIQHLLQSLWTAFAPLLILVFAVVAILKIAETVASDGAYTCAVLEQREAKQGEGLYWGGPE